jgi:acyl-CoA synthetase (AMP-forming)/AMP-acid ligase II
MGFGVPWRLRRDWSRQWFMAAAPLFHINGLSAVKFAFAVHSSLVLMLQFRAVPFIHALAQRRCMLITSVPITQALMLPGERVQKLSHPRAA